MAQSNKSVAKQGVDDLVMLPKVTEQAIIDNIKKRYDTDIIYAFIGPVLVSVNPYRDLKNSSEALVAVYHGHFPHETPPHVFALAEEAHRAMKSEATNQCILISGESGAGKTEAAKIVMQYISFVTGKSSKVEYVKSVVLESNPLLEAFGNAKTLRNNNSSRFGKYFEIQFDIAGDPCGGRITNYLLEKSRVVYQQGGERNFHFFYNLLAGASNEEANALTLYEAKYFYYVNQGNAFTVDGMNDREDFQDVNKAMQVVGIDDNERWNVLCLVAGILHLGNVAFVEGKKGQAQVQDAGLMQTAATLLQVNVQSLQQALLFRVIQTGGQGQAKRSSTYNVPQNAEQANGAKDALARELYSRMFDWVVAKVNTALQRYQAPFKTVIGILDIFGFEIFENNGFEQFCINYVNEKLQQYFIELTLKAEQDEYVKEGIKWTPIKYFNNKIVCELIEGKQPPGMFSLLDDICYTIHAQAGTETDRKFLEKCVGLFNQHPHFRPFNGAFQIKHYAGDVTYNVDGLSDKNKDTLFGDLVETMQTSANPFLVSLFPEDVKTPQKKRPTTAGFKIKTSCNELMTALSACNPHYIRCIKPNDNKKPRDWNEKRVQHQVQYLGLLENVRVRRAGFAYRAPFERFLDRYKKLSSRTWGMWGQWTGSPLEGCKTICAELQLDQNQWQMGKSKIFIRHPETLFFLEECVERKDYEFACKITKAWKKWTLAKRALEQRARAANILRGRKERRSDSVNRQFVGDYMNYDDNFALQEEVTKHSRQEAVLFTDQVIKLNRRNNPERRDFIMTDQAFYVVTRVQENGVVSYKLTRRAALADIDSVSLSSLQDNWILFSIGKEYDHLMECSRKTEILALLYDNYYRLTGRQLQMNFNDNVTFKIKSGDTRQIQWQRNEQCGPQSQLKKAGRLLTVMIGSGLDKNTDSTPTGLSINSYGSGGGGGGGAPRGGRGGARGGGPAGGRGGAANRGAPQGGRGGAQQAARPPPPVIQEEEPVQQAPAPSRGRGMPAGAGAGRGAPSRGAPAGGRGGARPPAPPAAKAPTATAQFDYQASTPDELSFRVGEVLTIVKKDNGGWWEMSLNGKRGWCPANYLQEN